MMIVSSPCLRRAQSNLITVEEIIAKFTFFTANGRARAHVTGKGGDWSSKEHYATKRCLPGLVFSVDQADKHGFLCRIMWWGRGTPPFISTFFDPLWCVASIVRFAGNKAWMAGGIPSLAFGSAGLTIFL